MTTILYARVSTTDQTLDIQRTAAEAAGYSLDHVIADHGVSGRTVPLAQRPQGRRLFDMLRRGDTLVVRWVDRLGRDYHDVSDNMREFMRRGVIVRTIIHGMTFDGAATDPMTQAVRDSLIAFMAATAQAQAEATREAQRNGIEQAKLDGEYLGRQPSYSRAQYETVVAMHNQGESVGAIAKATELSRQTVYRITGNRAKAEASLISWERVKAKGKAKAA